MSLFIAIEGIDGSGKSVQAALLKLALERLGRRTSITKAKSPDQDSAVREFKKKFCIGSDSVAFMFLYQALHRQQYERTVKLLEKGRVVIADRWDTSFFVYHGITGPLYGKQNVLETLNELAFEGKQPDLRFFIDTPIDIAIERRLERGDSIPDVDAEKRFYGRVADEYRRLFSRLPHHRIHGAMPIEEVGRQMLTATMQRL